MLITKVNWEAKRPGKGKWNYRTAQREAMLLALKRKEGELTLGTGKDPEAGASPGASGAQPFFNTYI